MSTTNDPQAPYGTPTERTPILSDAEIRRWAETMSDLDKWANALTLERLEALFDAKKSTARAPMLSDEKIMGPKLNTRFPHMMSARRVRDWYEAKITSGELIINPDYKS